MADGYDIAYKNIDELETLAAPAAGDFLVIYDASEGVYKKIAATYFAAA